MKRFLERRFLPASLTEVAARPSFPMEVMTQGFTLDKVLAPAAHASIWDCYGAEKDAEQNLKGKEGSHPAIAEFNSYLHNQHLHDEYYI